jgi:hypothetical protein
MFSSQQWVARPSIHSIQICTIRSKKNQKKPQNAVARQILYLNMLSYREKEENDVWQYGKSKDYSLGYRRESPCQSQIKTRYAR